MFIDRLKNYRVNELKINTRREMAEKMSVSEQLYAMVERGARKPSKDFLDKLLILSGRPEEYWLYGVDGNDILDKRHEFKSIESTVIDLIESGIITDSDFDEEVEKVLIQAIKADIDHLILKKKREK